MSFAIHVSGFVAIYVFLLAGFAGWVIIGRVPAILHTPLMSGSNFVHGIVVIGGIFALLNASTVPERALGFVAVLLGSGNAAGGYAVTERMLAMFRPPRIRREPATRAKPAHPMPRPRPLTRPRQGSLNLPRPRRCTPCSPLSLS